MPRPSEFYRSPSGDVMVPPEIARVLWRLGGLEAFRDRTRISARGTELASVLEALRQSVERWAASVVPNDGTTPTEPDPPMPQSLTTKDTAHHLGITPRAVTKAISQGKLTATRTGRIWSITREDLEHFKATRTENTCYDHHRGPR